jgi:DNA-binding transcriptional LysR family regulator
MEMHQVRYFLAVSQTLNFTRAAEECHVAQPSLTRAVKLLEEELGASLFRRERKLTHLTEFGERMLPYLRQCYDSAQSAKLLAGSIRTGAVAPLNLALSITVDLAILTPVLMDLTAKFPGLTLKFLRGSADEISEILKKGEAEIAVSGMIRDKWDRLDSWSLFSEQLMLVVPTDHPLAQSEAVDVSDINNESLLTRPYCEAHESAAHVFGRDRTMPGTHEIASDDDVLKLAEAGFGIGILPASTSLPASLRRRALRGTDLQRTVYLYNVAGRGRSPACTALMKCLRARDWTMMARH